MKFSNGQWLMKKGMECFAPQHVVETRTVETKLNDHTVKELCFFMPTRRIQHKGDTLEGVVLELRVSSPAEGVIRLRIVHNRGVCDRSPRYDLDFTMPSLEWRIEGDCYLVQSGNLVFELNAETGDFRFLRGKDIITESSERDLALIKTNWQGFAYDDHNPEEVFVRQQFDLAVGETIYGMGERFTPFVRNGQSVTIWNEDGGTSTEQSYKNIPFYLSSQGYGLFVNHTGKVEFEIGTENVSKVAFSVSGESLDYFFFDGPEPKDVIQRYTDMTGKPALPAPWTFGLWLSTSFTTKYDEETVMHFIDGMLDRDIPLEVFHFDCGWMRSFHWMDFTWDKEVFPDSEGLIQRIHEKGIKVCVWINPYVGQASPAFDEGMERGYFLKRPNGDVWQWDMWQPGLAIVDFTNPEAKDWYLNKLSALLDMGVDCFKTDFGERIPTDCVYANGKDPKLMHNYYTYLFNEAVFSLLKEKKGEDQAILFARSATTGGQKFPVHWGGDCWSTYPSMAESLRGGLSLLSSGFGFWSHDIGGFEHTSTPDVYKRWAAFGLLSTHSRLHGSSSYRVPWLYDDEAVEVVRYFTNLKLKLLPYLYSLAVKTSKTGIPLMRPMLFDFPQDENVSYLDRQYMLGDDLVVAPIFNDRGESSVYLPAGKWTHFLNRQERELSAGTWIKSVDNYFTIPIWVKENSLIPLQNTAERKHKSFNDRYGDSLFIEVYDLSADCHVDVYEHDELLTTLTARVREGEVWLEFNGPTCPIHFMTQDVEVIEGAELRGGSLVLNGSMCRVRIRK